VLAWQQAPEAAKKRRSAEGGGRRRRRGGRNRNRLHDLVYQQKEALFPDRHADRERNVPDRDEDATWSLE